MEVFSCRAIGNNVKRRLYEGVAMYTPLYGTEIWSMAVAEKTTNGLDRWCEKSIE